MLGGFELLDSSARGIPLSSRKARALVALLALRQPRGLARDKICGLLWPEDREDRARHSLRQALLTVRKAMGGALVGGERMLALDTSCVRVDVVQVQAQLDLGTREALASAAKLYRGDLLDGMILSEHPFEQWLSLERERARGAMTRGLTRLIELDSDAGQISDAVTACTQLLQLDPLNEQAHRMLMRLQWRQGRRASALQTYQSFARRLEAELGVEPEPEFRQLYLELQSAAVVRVAPPAPVVQAKRRAAPDGVAHARVYAPEVTRESELEALRHAYGNALGGGPAACLVLGEEGVGKTHLCDHFARDAGGSGVRVLRGSCFESEQVLPFSLWANLFANADVAAEAQILASIPTDLRAELARLIPDLAGTPPPRDSAEVVPLFRAVEALFLQLARSARLLLILEDLHWADEMSLRLLCYLARRRIGFWIGTVRREEVVPAAFLQSALAELDRECHVIFLPIEPFSREQTVDLARQWAQHLDLRVASEAWAEQVWTLSEGNALVIVESARSHAEGALVDQLERLPVSERVLVMIRRRVQRLSVVSRELLALATVYDGELPLAAVRDMFAPEQLAAAAEELVEHKLMRASDDSIAFTHVRIRVTLHGEMLPVRRRLLHAQVAAALERQSGLHGTGWLGRVGYHYLRAGEVESAIEYLVRFAEQARRGHALGEALTALERAAQVCEQLPTSRRSETLIDLLIRQASCLAFLGRFAELVSRLEGEHARVEELGRPALASQYHFWWGFGLTVLGRMSDAETEGHRALEHASGCDDARNRGYVHGLLSYLCAVTGRASQGVRHGKVAVDLLWGGSDMPEARVLAASSLGVSCVFTGDWRGALDAAQLAASAAQADGSTRGRSLAAALEASVYLITEHGELALAAAGRAVEASNSPFTSALSYFTLASAQARTGQVKPAIAILQHIATQLEIHGIRAFSGLTLEGLADAQLRDGDPTEALRSATAAADAAREVSDPIVLGRALRTHGRAEHAAGRTAFARSDFEEARKLFELVGARLELAHTLAVIGELELGALRWPAANEALKRAAELFDELDLEQGTQKVAQLLRQVAATSRVEPG